MGALLSLVVMLHLLQDFQYNSVGCLSLAVPLRVAWSRSPVLNAILLQQTSHILVYKWGPIVTDQIPGDPKSGDNVLTDEIGDYCPSDFLQRNGFHPFCEVFSNC